MFKFLLYKFGQFIVNKLPIKLSYKIATFISDSHYFFSFRDRKAVRNNLKSIIKSQEDLKFLTREVFRNFGRYLVEFFTMNSLVDVEYINRMVEIQGLDKIKESLKLERGAIVITAHVGNWELGAVVLNKLNYSLTAIALPHKERKVNDLFNYQREVKGIKVIPTNIAVRKCIETLKNNNLIALVADRDFTQNGEVLNFLGKETLIPKGAATFSQKTGAPIIPVFLIRKKDFTFKLIIYDPIFPDNFADIRNEREKVIAIIEKYLCNIEDIIKQYPDQWLMFRKYWLDENLRHSNVKLYNNFARNN